MLKIYKKVTKMKKLLKLINLLQNSYSPTTIYDCSIKKFFETECLIEQNFEPRVIMSSGVYTMCIAMFSERVHLSKYEFSNKQI